MEENKNVTAGEIALVYIALFLLILTASFVGLSEFVSFVILPALLAYSTVRLGYRHALLQCGLIVLLYSFISGGLYEAALLTVLPGFCVGICVRRRKTLLHTVTASSIVMVLTELLMYLIEAFRSQTDVQFLESFSQQGAQFVEMLALPAKESAVVLEMLNLYIPAILVLSVAMMSYGIVFVLRFMLVWRAPGYALIYPRFRALKASKSCLFFWGLSWIVSVIDDSTIGIAFANMTTILSCYIVVCGFAVFVSWISRMRSFVMRMLLYISLFWMFSLLTPAAFVVGTIDAVVCFRRKGRGDTHEK